MGKQIKLIVRVLLLSGILFLLSWGEDVLANHGNLNEHVTNGKDFLKVFDFVNSNSEFEAALVVDPNHEEANFYYSFTRIAVLLSSTELNNLLDGFGVDPQGRDIQNWTADFQRDIDGKIVLPANSPTGDLVVNYLETILLLQVEGALVNLSKVGNNFSSSFSFGDGIIDFDYGDAAFYNAFLLFSKLVMGLVMSYDFGVDIDDIVSNFNYTHCFTIIEVLNTYVNLLELLPVNYLSQSGTALYNAVEMYKAASTYVINETDNQSDDFIVIDNEDLESEDYFRNILVEIQSSLSGPTLINLGKKQSWVLQDDFLFGGGEMRVSLNKNGNQIEDGEYTKNNYNWPSPLGVPCYGDVRNFHIIGNSISFDIINEDVGFDCPCDIQFTGTLNNALDQIISGTYNGVNNSGVISGSFTGLLSDNDIYRYNVDLGSLFFTNYNLKNYIPIISKDVDCNVDIVSYPDDTFGGVLPDGIPNEPNISVLPLNHNFGCVNVGNTSTVQTFTISNTGTNDLVIGVVGLTGATPLQFNIKNNNCSMLTIPPSGNCSIDIVFSPTSTGSKSANLSIPSNDPDIPTMDISISGTSKTELCPCAIVLQDNPSDLKLLQRYRDESLSKTNIGKLLTKLFYMVSAKAVETLNDNPELIAEARSLIDKNRKDVSDVLDGRDGVIYNTDEIVSFLSNYANDSPPLLKVILNVIKKDMLQKKKRGELFFGFKLE
ncbi:subtilisin-like serine protease [Candidatus Scalindua japonica]|uniref:Subtilisin-like serine protease n=1 Tax=Candidatus Scalindua japonica TaxID=1284222 RepID=A0A286TXR9_9BACT|nr:choice-of-anchor D domain-containing protein [Candidatus Scalindua japonica]GAX60611.1 subtilisin-like serine protease [Candidatus Scalindua japonica]